MSAPATETKGLLQCCEGRDDRSIHYLYPHQVLQHRQGTPLAVKASCHLSKNALLQGLSCAPAKAAEG